MKTIILTITAIAFAVANSTAQVDNRSKFRFGIKAGANYSNIYDSQTDKLTANGKAGLVGGAFISFPLSKIFGLQPEVLFSQKGFKGTGTLLGSNYDLTRTTTYLDVPILFAVKPIEYLTLLVGPQYSFLLKQKDVLANSTTSVDQQKTFTNDNVRKNILCLTGGADLNLGRFIVGGRVGWDLQNNNGDGTSTTPRYKNVWYQATIGIRIL
jgi:Outer membrane protein beta-barrel domain